MFINFCILLAVLNAKFYFFFQSKFINDVRDVHDDRDDHDFRGFHDVRGDRGDRDGHDVREKVEELVANYFLDDDYGVHDDDHDVLK